MTKLFVMSVITQNFPLNIQLDTQRYNWGVGGIIPLVI